MADKVHLTEDMFQPAEGNFKEVEKLPDLQFHIGLTSGVVLEKINWQ